MRLNTKDGVCLMDSRTGPVWSGSPTRTRVSRVIKRASAGDVPRVGNTALARVLVTNSESRTYSPTTLRQQSSAPMVVQAGEQLSISEREALINEIERAIPLAYAAFVSACKDAKRRDSMQRLFQVQRSAALLDMFLGIALGVAGVAASRAIGRLATRFKTPARSLAPTRYVSVPEHARLLHGLRMPKRVGISAKIADLASDETLMREVLKSSTMGVLKNVRASAVSIFDTSATEAFVTHLEVTMQHAAFEVGRRVNQKRSDEELIALWFAHHPALANVGTYSREIDALVAQHQLQVQPIGARPGFLTYACILEDFRGRRRLALVRLQLPAGDVSDPSQKYPPTNWEFDFIRWISDDMAAVALAATSQLNRRLHKPLRETYDLPWDPWLRQHGVPFPLHYGRVRGAKEEWGGRTES